MQLARAATRLAARHLLTARRRQRQPPPCIRPALRQRGTCAVVRAASSSGGSGSDEGGNGGEEGAPAAKPKMAFASMDEDAAATPAGGDALLAGDWQLLGGAALELDRDGYKEDSRKYFRTVFDFQRW